MSAIFEKYLSKQPNNEKLIASNPNKDLSLIVIIPAFNEPDIIRTLESLKNCDSANKPSEVIVFINDSETTIQTIKNQNETIHASVNHWITKNSNPHLSFYCIYCSNLPKKHAGVGLARKLIMDEAIRRFEHIKNDQGIIASLDADSLVSANYLRDIQKLFIQNLKANCLVFNFKHQLNGDLPEQNTKAIILYELYLHYFKQALHYTGFPYYYHTIGSCFAIKAETYSAQGGMNRKQAGEDFYFLQKMFALEKTMDVKNITVYPSARISERVPFGTGAAIKKIITDAEYYAYKPEFFSHLKTLFAAIDKLHQSDINNRKNIYNGLDYSLQQFMNWPDFNEAIIEINKNSSSINSFRKRFYGWFDTFKIIKYLNFVHLTTERIPITNAVYLFLESLKVIIDDTSAPTLLNEMRLRNNHI